MRRIREVLRLRAELGPNVSAIAAGARLARSTVRAYLDRAEAAGVDAAAAELLLVAVTINIGLSRTFRASTQRSEREHGVEQSRRDRTWFVSTFSVY